MKTEGTSWKSKVSGGIGVATRLVLGATFLFMGLHKAMHPEEFLKLMRQYEVVQNPLMLNLIAADLPWLEVFLGLLLIAGVAIRGTALTLIGMLVPMTVLVFKRALYLQATAGIPFCALKFDCGCGAGEEFICRKLSENIILVIMAAWLLLARSQLLCARYSLRRSVAGGDDSPGFSPVKPA